MTTVRIHRSIFVFALASLFVTAPLGAEWTQDGPRGMHPAMRHRLISNTPGQVSNLSDAVADGRNMFVVWREENRSRDEVRFQISADGGRTFAFGDAGRVLATLES